MAVTEWLVSAGFHSARSGWVRQDAVRSGLARRGSWGEVRCVE